MYKINYIIYPTILEKILDQCFEVISNIIYNGQDLLDEYNGGL